MGVLPASSWLGAEEVDYLKRLAEMTAPETLAQAEPREVARIFARSLAVMEILRGEGMEPAEAVESALLRNGTDSLRRELLSGHLTREFARFAARGESELRVARLIRLEEEPELGRELLNYVLSGDLRPDAGRVERAREALRDVQRFAPPLQELAKRLRARHQHAVAVERQASETRYATQVAQDRSIAGKREANRRRFAEALHQKQWQEEQRDDWKLPTLMDQRRAYNSPGYGYSRSYCYPRVYYYPVPRRYDYDDGLKTRPAGIYKAPLGLKNEEPVRGSYIRVD
jgi:hypothetical protein